MIAKEISAQMMEKARYWIRKVIFYSIAASAFYAPVVEAAGISTAVRIKRAVYSYAAQGNLKALTALKERGISLDTADENGNTALCASITFRNVMAYNTLVSAGADLEADCVRNIPEKNLERFCANANLADRSVCTAVAGSTTGISMSTPVMGAIGVGVLGIAAAAAFGGGGGGGGDTPACTTDADCSGHGVCTDGSCICIDGYTGVHCEIEPKDLCKGVDCGEHGSCNPDTGMCVCRDGWTGSSCEKAPEDPCEGVVCGPHAVCNAGQCICEPGYKGEDCHQDLCYQVSCGEHGTCNETTGKCDCQDYYSGDFCEKAPPTHVPEPESIDADVSAMCPSGYSLINGVCTKQIYGDGTTPISLTPDDTDEGGDPLVSNPLYLAEFGGTVTNSGEVTIDGTILVDDDPVNDTQTQIAMWANGVSPEALSDGGSTVFLDEASVATNTGTINACEANEETLGLIAMKATSAGTIENQGTINVTALSPNMSAAMDVSRIQDSRKNKGANINNKGTINLTAQNKAYDVRGIYAPDRNVVNDEGAEINVVLGTGTMTSGDVDEHGIVRGMTGELALNRGLITAKVADGVASGATVKTDLRLMEASGGGKAANDGQIDLNLTNMVYDVNALYANADAAKTTAVNNGTINVTGSLYNNPDIAKQVYLIAGNGESALLNDGNINIGSTVTDEYNNKQRTYFNMPSGGVLHAMNGAMGTATNNNTILMNLNLSDTSKVANVAAMTLGKGTMLNSRTIDIDIKGETSPSSSVTAMETEGAKTADMTNKGIIQMNSTVSGVTLSAFKMGSGKLTNEGDVIINSSGANSNIYAVLFNAGIDDEDRGSGRNSGNIIINKTGGSGNIQGFGGANAGNVYIKAEDIGPIPQLVFDGQDYVLTNSNSMIVGTGVYGSGSNNTEKGVVDIELTGNTYADVIGFDHSSKGGELVDKNRIAITAQNGERNGSLFVIGSGTEQNHNPSETSNPGTLTYAGNMELKVQGSPNASTAVFGLVGVNQHVINNGVVTMNVNLGESNSHAVVGMYVVDDRTWKEGHRQYKAVNNNTIDIDVTGNHSSVPPSYNLLSPAVLISPDDRGHGQGWLPFDVVGMVTNSYAVNNNTIKIRVSGDATAAGMVAYDGGVIQNKGKILFSGNANNFTPLYGTGSRDVVLEKDKNGKETKWERVFASIYNSGSIIINGQYDDLNDRAGQGYYGKYGDGWAYDVYKWNEETQEYEKSPTVGTAEGAESTTGKFTWFDTINGSDGPVGDPIPVLNFAQNINYISELNGVLSAPGYQLVGDVIAGSTLIMNGNRDVYIGNGLGEGALIGNGDISGLGLMSGSVLFNATYQPNAVNANGVDIVMTRRSFDEVVSNASLADFLERNYAAGNNEAFFNKLKSFGDMHSLTNSLDKLTGKEMLSRFNFEDMTMMRELNFDMNEQLFHNKEQAFSLAGSVSPMAFRGDTGSSARYSLFNKREGKLSVGFGVAFTDIRSDNAHDKDDRRDSLYQLVVPVGYRTHGFNLMTSPRIGYARGTYDRTGFDDKTYDGTIEKRVYGLMNEARYPLTFGEWTVEPSAEFNILGYTQKGHEDAKEYSLNIKSQNTYSMEGGIGLHLTKDKELSKDSRIKLTAGVAAYHEFADPYRLEVGMNGMDGSFTLRDENRSENRGVVRAGFDYEKGDYSLYGMFMSYIDREIRSSLRSGLKWKF